jgi:outer membrane murein-binding lipoprotein Lpp
VWLVSSPDDDPTREALKVALKRGDQQGACAALEKLLTATERDPSACLLLGLVRSSMGPRFDAAVAKELITEFLERTPADRFPQDQQIDADTSRDAIVDRLTSFQDLKGTDDLGALRLTATALLKDLDRKPPKRSLFHPDKQTLSTQLSSKESELLKLTADQEKNRAKISDAERELARCKQEFENWRRKPVRQRGVSDPQPWIDAIERCSTSLDRLQSEAKKLALKLESISKEVEALRARMSRFD